MQRREFLLGIATAGAAVSTGCLGYTIESEDGVAQRKTRIEQLEQTATEREQRVDELEDQLSNFQDQIDEKESTVQRLQQTATDRGDKIQSLEDELESVEEQLEETRTQNRLLERRVENLEGEQSEREYDVLMVWYESALESYEFGEDKYSDATQSQNTQDYFVASEEYLTAWGQYNAAVGATDHIGSHLSQRSMFDVEDLITQTNLYCYHMRQACEYYYSSMLYYAVDDITTGEQDISSAQEEVESAQEYTVHDKSTIRDALQQN